MDTGENAQALRGITDFLRKGSLALLALHFYIFCYEAFAAVGLRSGISDKILLRIAGTELLGNIHLSKALVLLLLLVSVTGTKGKKDEKTSRAMVALLCTGGIVLFWGGTLSFYLSLSMQLTAGLYISLTTVGYFLLLAGGSKVSRLIRVQLKGDIFNEENESFPQEEQLITNEHSLNFPAIYHWKGRARRMFVNIVNPYRATLLVSGPGGGKSRYFVIPALKQMVQKGYVLFCYDWKYDDLTKVVYNTYLQFKNTYKKPPGFYVINFDDLSRSHRCNPLDPDMMEDMSDAMEASRSILIGLNRDWARKTGEFFVESPINFMAACIWYLKRYKDGRYCTLPHVIELLMLPYEELFPMLGSVPELESIVNPFWSAWINKALEQLEGQIASAKIGMARLSSPHLYYILSGSDFTLDINNPDDPKIVCCGNNPMKLQTYGAVISLYGNRMLKLVNRKGKIKCGLVFDEYPTIYLPLDHTVASGRSNLLAPIISVQSIEQIRKDYSKEQADVLISICGNIVAGQCSGDSAKFVSERIGKIVQVRENISINRTDTSVSKNTQLDYAVPVSKIANLSAGVMVGTVADNPHEKIRLKAFSAEFTLDDTALKEEEDSYKPLPVVRNVTPLMVQNNFITIKNDIDDIAETEMERIKNDPDLCHLIIQKPEQKPEK